MTPVIWILRVPSLLLNSSPRLQRAESFVSSFKFQNQLSRVLNDVLSAAKCHLALLYLFNNRIAAIAVLIFLRDMLCRLKPSVPDVPCLLRIPSDTVSACHLLPFVSIPKTVLSWQTDPNLAACQSKLLQLNSACQISEEPACRFHFNIQTNSRFPPSAEESKESQESNVESHIA